MNPLIQLKKTTPKFLVAFGLICFGLLPGAKAADPGAPDMALAGGNTADGQLALGANHRYLQFGVRYILPPKQRYC